MSPGLDPGEMPTLVKTRYPLSDIPISTSFFDPHIFSPESVHEAELYFAVCLFVLKQAGISQEAASKTINLLNRITDQSVAQYATMQRYGFNHPFSEDPFKTYYAISTGNPELITKMFGVEPENRIINLMRNLSVGLEQALVIASIYKDFNPPPGETQPEDIEREDSKLALIRGFESSNLSRFYGSQAIRLVSMINACRIKESGIPVATFVEWIDELAKQGRNPYEKYIITNRVIPRLYPQLKDTVLTPP